MRLALKAFAGQKKRFFPHLEDEMHNQKHSGEFGASKKLATSVSSVVVHKDEPYSERSLSDILNDIEAESSFAKISTYQRLDWLKRASSLSPSANEPPGETSKENNVHTSSKIRAEVQGAPALDQIAVIELLVPSVFRAVVSLNPAGSINRDAVAFFSPDEGGSYIHARGSSVYRVFRNITVTKGFPFFPLLQIHITLLESVRIFDCPQLYRSGLLDQLHVCCSLFL
ncbi:mediator of RNA polymerase II transcription subunit 27-like [Nymphaea colorata]|nr:mediator of RNA polymerase II transcription subunit 27-like [Nymphaea colorata]